MILKKEVPEVLMAGEGTTAFLQELDVCAFRTSVHGVANVIQQREEARGSLL